MSTSRFHLVGGAALLGLLLGAEAPAAPYLVRDINATSGQGSDPQQLTVVGGTLFFAASEPRTGEELWRSDGTAAGTARVADLDPGIGGSAPAELTDVGGVLFFVASSPDAGRELWRSDGTAAGTRRVEDVNPGPDGSAAHELTDVGGVLFFVASDPERGAELWRSDGTAAGTVRVADLNPGPADSRPSDLVDVGGTLFFAATDGSGDRELWRSDGDGTAAGTMRVADVSPGPEPSNPYLLTSMDGALFFFATIGGQKELWRSDSTGTARLARLGFPPFGEPESLIAIDGTLFFDVAGVLWKSDGTEEGTTEVHEPFDPAQCIALHDFTDVGGTLFFAVCECNQTCALWKSDGSRAGTEQVADFDPSDDPDEDDWLPPELAAVGGVVFFAAVSEESGLELWRSDGTAAGTVGVADVYAGVQGSKPDQLVDLNGRLVFAAEDLSGGRELWQSDGTAAGTVQVANVNPATGRSLPGSLTRVNGLLLFAASEPGTGRELWKSDGTAAGTVLVADLVPGGGSSDPSDLTAVRGMLFFAAHDPEGSLELWRSDGTAPGTNRLATFPIGDFHPRLRALTDVAGTLFFSASAPDGNGDIELWKSDGTEGGTVRVADINPGALGSGAMPAAVLGETLLLVACEPVAGCELWRSDGTAAGTVRVTDLVAGPGNTSFSEFAPLGGRLVFTARTQAGWGVWATDGTAEGTALLRNQFAVGLTTVGERVLFAGCPLGEGCTLWKSDGTAAGTVQVSDMRVEEPGFRSLVNVGGTLFFRSGGGLWRSDGSAAGTVAVPGPSMPLDLANVNGTLFFTAEDPAAGRELWTSDGTAAGTARLTDIVPGPGSTFESVIRNAEGFVVEVNGTLFFTALDQDHGEELWGLALGGSRCGDGVLDPGEECDDANRVDGDCCGGGCALEPPGSRCTDDGDACTEDRCAEGTCRHTPQCDDANLCTVDTCTPDGCRHDAVIGVEAVRCLFGGAGLESPACAGEDIPDRVGRRMTRVRDLLDAASGPRPARKVKRALKVLKGVSRRLRRSPRVAEDCAGAVRVLLEEARRAAKGLRTG